MYFLLYFGGVVLNQNQILHCTVEELASWAVPKFFTPISVDVETVEGLNEVSKCMQNLSNQYAFLASMLAVLKYSIRQAKDNKNKVEADELIDKREIMQRALDNVKQQQSTVSRMITIRQEVNRELGMNGGVIYEGNNYGRGNGRSGGRY